VRPPPQGAPPPPPIILPATTPKAQAKGEGKVLNSVVFRC
jgi:hypothetical protein